MILRVLDESLYEEPFGPSMEGDAGIDLRAREDTMIPCGRTMVISLGVSIKLESGQVGWLTGRSSTAITWDLLTHEGKIDSGYRGEIHCICTALSRRVAIQRGERICQLVVLEIADPASWVTTTIDLGYSARGKRGLGSTGRN